MESLQALRGDDTLNVVAIVFSSLRTVTLALHILRIIRNWYVIEIIYWRDIILLLRLEGTSPPEPLRLQKSLLNILLGCEILCKV